MRVSKYIKLDVNILMEYIYDDANLISEPYEILTNLKNTNNTYLSSDNSGLLNTLGNQLFEIDPINRNYGKVDTTNYNFLQVNNYASGFPLRYDTVIIRLPINYTFGEHIGFYLRAYSFDAQNKKTIDLTNFFFDISDTATKNYIDYTNPPILYQEKLWGKEVRLEIPSLYGISSQRKNNIPPVNTVNYNLTNGIGFSQQTPLFFEFSFINTKQTLNSITTYYLAPKILANLPQSPEFENLGVMIEHSQNGDYFELYGVYNNSLADFNTFINNSVYTGNRYYVQYVITMYEQNIRGKSLTITVTDNFNEKIEYRPIIKYTNTTAVIDVEMYLIDSVDSSQILRKSSYGMLQDQVSKYSLNLTKINLASATKPKIYNYKSKINNSLPSAPVTNIEIIDVPFAVLVDKFNVSALSENAISGTTIFYGEGLLTIMIKPFDNIIKFIIAKSLSRMDKSIIPEYLDLSNFGEIKLVFKNTNSTVEFPLFLDNDEVDLTMGSIVFRVTANKIPDIRKIYDSGVNIFYITATSQNITTNVYSGLFRMFDSIKNVNTLNTRFDANLSTAQAATNLTIETPTPTTSGPPKVIIKYIKNDAAVLNGTNNDQLTTAPGKDSSIPSQVNIQVSKNIGIFKHTTPYPTDYFFVIETNSALSYTIGTYRTWQSTDIKNKLGLSYYPSSLTFRDSSGKTIPNMGGSSDRKDENVFLYSKEANLGNILDIVTKLLS